MKKIDISKLKQAYKLGLIHGRGVSAVIPKR